MEASLIITAVFNNQILVEKFLEEATDDIRDSMQFRLVNKTFRDACHSNFRKNHRDLIIEFVKSDSRDGNDNPVYINNRSVSSADSYFLFLKNVAKVRIQSIVVKDLWQLAPSTQLSLHDSIRGSLIKNGGDSLKKLIGMDEICPGNCEDCVRIPKECVEYGPLQFEHLMELFTKPRVFEKLIVPDYLLDDIANSCIACSASEDDCFKAIHDFIPSNSSCKVLVLKISESRKDLTGRGCRDHKAMPQEVIDFMLKQWSVQSVVLEFVHETHWIDYKGEWARKGWFTGLCFSDSRDRLEKSSMKLKEVTVDLTTSYLFSTHLRLPNKYRTSKRFYQNLVANIKRVFRNDRLKIQFSPSRKIYSKIDDVVQGVLQNINNGDLRNLEVEISMYMKHRNNYLYFNKLSNQEPQLRPDVFNNFQIFHHLNTSSEWLQPLGRGIPSVFPLKNNDWIGNSCQFVNKERYLTVNWTYFVNMELQRSSCCFYWL